MGKGGYRKGRKRPNDSGPGGYASRQKHANGEGDYPPEHVLENPAFETYYRESGIVPEAEWDAVWKPWPTRPASAAQAASGSCPRLAEAQGSLERDLALRAALGAPADRRPEPACWPRRWEDFMKTLRRPLGVSFRITGAPSDPGAVALGEFMRARHMTQLSGSAARSRWPPRQRPSSASVPDSLSAWHPERPSPPSSGLV